MKTYKALLTGLAVASLLGASVASAQVATTTTSTGPNAAPLSGPDLAIAMNGSGILLDATNSTVPIQVMSLPISLSGAIGANCQLSNNGTLLGTLGSGTAFTNPVVVPARGSVVLPVTCTGATPGTYTVSVATSLIPAIVQGTSQSITPRGIGGASNNDTTAVGTLTIGSGGTVTGTTGTGTTGTGTGSVGTGTGSVLGTSTNVPNIPNTGAGGEAAQALAILAVAALAVLAGLAVLARKQA